MPKQSYTLRKAEFASVRPFDTYYFPFLEGLIKTYVRSVNAKGFVYIDNPSFVGPPKDKDLTGHVRFDTMEGFVIGRGSTRSHQIILVRNLEEATANIWEIEKVLRAEEIID